MLNKGTKKEMSSSRWNIIIKPNRNIRAFYEKEYKMNKNNKSAWVIGGTTLIGIGVGFIFLRESALLFVASILIGIGVGVVIASLTSREKG